MVKVSHDHRYVLFVLWGGIVVFFVGLIVTIAGVSALQNAANSLSLQGASPEFLQACAWNFWNCWFATHLSIPYRQGPVRPREHATLP